MRLVPGMAHSNLCLPVTWRTSCSRTYAIPRWCSHVKKIIKLQKEPAQQANQTGQAASLQAKKQDCAEIMEEEMSHWDQVSILSQMLLWQVKEMKA